MIHNEPKKRMDWQGNMKVMGSAFQEIGSLTTGDLPLNVIYKNLFNMETAHAILVSQRHS